MLDLFDCNGQRVPLGKKIGTGGEGSVYDLHVQESNLVAKIYHKPISNEKQAKLLGMAKGCDDSLKSIAAWPMETLHEKSGGAVRGFLMSKVADYEPIHHLYGPSHRKQRYPDKDWAFLVNAARNTAAAFDTIHSHGHIIGDVNPNLVFVAGSSTVKLIDCDSFQVISDGTYYLCEVGVPHFTPPELQNMPSFHGVRRTRNHDNFGLALLIFHILLMGRHPFSGVYSGTGDMALEKAIAQFRYAFGLSSASKGMSPPPNSVTPKILPDTLSSLFEKAFGEQGQLPEGRPTAKHWVGALDSLKGQLRTCGQDSIHKYFGGLSSCPWCVQEQRAGNIFFVSLVSTNFGVSTFDLSKVWAEIIFVKSPGVAPEISSGGFNVVPKPLPVSLQDAKNVVMYKKIAAIGLIVACLIVAPSFFLLALIVAGFLFFSSVDDHVERNIRQRALNTAREHMVSIQERWSREAGDSKFQLKLKELGASRKEYESLANQLFLERQKLQQNLHANQLYKFLDKFFIENATIKGVGPTRKATLASFGIETAADVEWNKIIRISGFGASLTSSIISWRKSFEKKFVFDTTKGIDPADIAALNHRFSQNKKQLEGILLAGPERLNQIRSEIVAHRTQMFPMVQNAARQLAQAQKDFSII